jgi:DNA ligase D-like protein (predicted 3'-phosphoesterase)
VRGRVQGVGFRWAVVQRAEQLGVLGWVRNDADAVRVHAEGDGAAVDELVAFLHSGPPGAGVDAVEVENVKPEGHEQFAIRGVSAGRFVVEPPSDGADGFVLRLEVDGSWRSWSLRREPSMRPADKRFAVAIADGPATSVEAGAQLWDQGSYEQGGRVPWPEAIERGHAVFVLHGGQLRGGFALQRTRGTGSSAQWLLIKRRDEFAAS